MAFTPSLMARPIQHYHRLDVEGVYARMTSLTGGHRQLSSGVAHCLIASGNGRDAVSVS